MDEHQLHPRDGFLVTNINYFSDFSNQVLTDLYLPIIGSKPYTLYLYLWSLTSKKIVSIDRYQHTRLINSVGESIEEIKNSLVKLEGIGLIRTFFKKDIIGTLFLYELSSPVSPDRFFSDDLLSAYLCETVGEKDYSDLLEKYTLHPANKEKFTEITASFFDVFNLDSVNFVNQKSNLNYQEERIPNHQKFDQKLFLTLMEKYGIEDTIINQNLRQFQDLSSFYNVNELELSNAIINSNCIQKDHFSNDKLIAYFNQRTSNKKFDPKKVSDDDLQDLNEADKKIIEKATSLSPLNFLKLMKEQFGGYITNSEASILQKLVRRQVLPNELINIMMYYEAKNYPTISQRVSDTIANDWLKHQIQSPAEALKYINNFKNKKPKKSVYFDKRKKPVPKWFNEDNQSNIERKNQPDVNDMIKKEERRRKMLEGKNN
ncbi:DnaD domain protein [Xylocopilactobacillus apis]|uniref:Helicase DnaB n=1 Tax=Xylocopilactobacillus apis TaxID=2932183 RepID=A0AAU9CVJ0_9LACO|nr:DnaD domain protein [Xylocopilactobacillus apis]BDR56391.1 helicase DnaB [Xylocopilactobacillus apis]